MNKQRKVLITITYNEVGIIIDTKAAEVAQPEKRTQERTETRACDLVSRQDAIDAVMDEFKRIPTSAIRAKTRIEALPSAQPEPQWIPCRKRLPEDGKWCLFTDGSNMSVERYKADAMDHFFPAGRWFDFEDAFAWMPLPEPYQAERREE